jgi:WD40 repeat protein
MSEPFEYIYALARKQIRKCDGNTGNYLQVYEGHLTSVNSICFTSNFEFFVSASQDETLFIWDADTGKKLQVLEGHVGEVWCVAISPDDLTIVSGGYDCNVMVWDLPTAKLRMTLKGHESSVVSVAITPRTGEKIASGSWDKTVRIWSLVGVDAGTLLFTLKGHADWVRSVIFIPCAAGQQLISGSDDGSIRVWNVDDGVNVGTIDVRNMVFSLAVNSFGDKVVCCCRDRSVRVYGLKGPHTQQLIRKMDGHANSVMTVAITPDEQHILSGSSDESIIKWNMESGEKLQTFGGLTNVVMSVACCPSALISDRDVHLKISGRIVNTSSREIVYTINPQTIVETREDNVILLEEEIVVTAIKASDAAKALEWKDWILAVKHHIKLPREQRARTASGIMNQYKSDCFQVININESAKVDFLPKHCVNLIIHYIYK